MLHSATLRPLSFIIVAEHFGDPSTGLLCTKAAKYKRFGSNIRGVSEVGGKGLGCFWRVVTRPHFTHFQGCFFQDIPEEGWQPPTIACCPARAKSSHCRLPGLCQEHGFGSLQ